MITKENSIVLIFKKYTVFIIVSITIVLVSMIILISSALANDYNNSVIINILGRQRMLTQSMAKGANQIFILRSADVAGRDASNIKEEMESLIDEINRSKEEYNKQINAIEKGYVLWDNHIVGFEGSLERLKPYLAGNKEAWAVFSASLDGLTSEGTDLSTMERVLKYINQKDDILLNYSDEITSIVANDVRQKSTMGMYYMIIIGIIFMVLLMVLIWRMYINLLIPINQIYKVMGEIGIARMDIPPEKVKSRQAVPVYLEVKGVFDKLNSLILLIENLNKNIPFKEILNYIFKSFSDYIPYTYIGVALLENGNMLKASFGAAGKQHENLPKRLLGYSIDINKTSLAKIIETGRERIINDLEEYVKGKPEKEYNKILLCEGIRSSITFPLKNNDKTVGIIFFSSSTKNVYRNEHVEFLRTLASSIMLGLEKSILMDDMIVSSVRALAGLAEQRDPETGEHLKRMATYSKVLAWMLSKHKKYEKIIDLDYIKDIERFSPLHDIGKVGIRDDILLKRGKLTGEEFAVMKTHTIYGAWVLKVAEENIRKSGRGIFSMAIDIAEGHHEKWDGSGYPHGRAGCEIPLCARIVAVADVFDALTSKRPYKEAFGFEESCNIIIENSGKHFDPDIVAAFINNIDTIKHIYEGFKSDGIL